MRRLGGARYGRVRGQAWVRNVTLHEHLPLSYPAPPIISVNASRSGDGRSLGILLINRSLTQSADCALTLAGTPAKRATAETLTGPAIDAINETDPNTVHLAPIDVALDGPRLQLLLPAMSMTGLRVELAQ